MNVLIIGEFSSFAKHLKKGFGSLGHKVTIVMTPDSFKQIKGEEDDIVYGGNLIIAGHPIRGSALLLKPFRALLIRYYLWQRYRKQPPDLIIVISSRFLTTSLFHPGTPLSFIKRQLSRRAKLIVAECGGSPASYYNHQDFYRERRSKVIVDDVRYSFLLKVSHAIIPTCYGYYDDLLKYNQHHSYDLTKVHNSIPLPITIENDCCINSCVDRKIVIFHGIIRPKDKGTPYIVEAMNRLQKEFPHLVECIAKGGMPYDEYVMIFNQIDILVDQTYGNGWGMNAIIGAMKGKCVLTPCGPENGKNMGIADIPFIQIGPDSNQIYNTLRRLVLNPQEIDRIKQSSRQFAEYYCASGKIAKQYIETVGLNY